MPCAFKKNRAVWVYTITVRNVAFSRNVLRHCILLCIGVK